MAALANDLNTAEARAPIFDLIRTANTAMDQGQFLAGDRDANSWPCWQASTQSST